MMLQQYTPLHQLTLEERKELNLKANALVEGQNIIVLSTGRVVRAAECRAVAQNNSRQALFG